VSLFRAAVAPPSLPAILYFDGSLSYAELDTQSDALACAWQDRGITRGERVAIYLQNIPQFVIALVAAWKLGAIAVPVNPMNRARELRVILADSGARLLVCSETLYVDIVRPLLAEEAMRKTACCLW
jgi:long-chain acyl-CoA synthetase